MMHDPFARCARKLCLAMAGTVVGLAAWLAPVEVMAADGKKPLVARIVQLQQADVENLARALVGQAMQPRLQSVGQALGKLPQDKRDALAKEIQADMRKTGAEMETLLREKALKLAPAVLSGGLEEQFSEDELRQIVTWLESSTARRFQQYSAGVQGVLVQKIVAESKAQIEPKLQALDQTIRTRFAAIGNPGGNAAPAAPAK